MSIDTLVSLDVNVSKKEYEKHSHNKGLQVEIIACEILPSTLFLSLGSWVEMVQPFKGTTVIFFNDEVMMGARPLCILVG